MLDSFVNFLILFGGLLAWLLSGEQLLIRSRTAWNYVRSALSFCVGVYLLYCGLSYFGILEQLPHLKMLHVPIAYCLGPLFYAYFWSLIKPKQGPSRTLIHHFIVPVAVLLFLLPLYFSDSSVKNCMEAAYRAPRGHVGCGLATVYEYPAIAILMGPKVFTLLYLIGFWVQIRSSWSKLPIIRGVYKFTFIFVTSLFIIALLGHFFFGTQLNRTGAFMGTITVCAIDLLDLRFSTYLQRLQIMSREGWKTSKLGKLNIDQIMERLRYVMEFDRFYEVENLTLKALAAECGVSDHQLSEILNDRLKKNFSVFVNEYRVEAARKLLCEKSGRTVLDIGLAVGFNSIHSFNRSFLKFTGLTPNEYRKKFG